jgi:hypothetical protein
MPDDGRVRIASELRLFGEEVIPLTATISPETVMACAIMVKTNAHEPVLIEEVSGLFAKLRQERIEEVGRVALRRLPRGFYSEDVEAFFGRLLAGGFAEARSPLAVNGHGVQLCLELINEEEQTHPEALAKVVRALGFDLSLIKNPTPHPQPV